jgi:hypothetical protein
MNSALHPIHFRLLAEELVRRRRADEQQRYIASQRLGCIDPNPHQVDAVVFALRRIPEGGCILADEVGLGKTIEAGLVIAQLQAEGARRILLIVPKSLLGQWQTELYSLFRIEAREGRADPEAFVGDGVFLVHREFAGSERGASLLVVIDEAHEVFASIYKRFDKDGNYNPLSTEARTADRVRTLLRRGRFPVLLLTATPIQNSLTELWGLVQYVEPSGTLLGKLPTFREIFCDGNDRQLVVGQAGELRRRVAAVLQRTLRRQAQDFLEVPFVQRQTKLFEYAMSTDEKALYDDVTAWILKPDLCAFRGNSRKLLLIGFHRRMASSLPAFSDSLGTIAERLRSQLERRGFSPSADRAVARELARDLEEEFDEEDDESEEPAPPPVVERLRAELAQVEAFVRRAEALPADSKAIRLLDAVRIAVELGKRGDGSGKLVIFTESIRTQDYIRDLLLKNGNLAPEDVTLFRGQNDSPRARAALDRWEEEVGRTIPTPNRPSRDIATRLALVHEFREHSKVFVSTEAGAKGLNLQFCETLINYDLPWNPQRIEQRIGRVHRYGQKRGVTVINFLARGNEAQKLTLEILSEKLELFGKVLDASDAVLHVPGEQSPESLLSGVGADFEAQLRRIYEEASSVEDITTQLLELRASIGAAKSEFEEEQARTASLIETRLDTSVRQVFSRYREDLPAGLAKLDQDLDQLLSAYLAARAIPFQRSEAVAQSLFRLDPSPQLPEAYRGGLIVGIGHARDLKDAEPLHLGHPLVRAAVEEARRGSARTFSLCFSASDGTLPASLSALAGRRGRVVVTKLSYRGIETLDHLVRTAMLEGDDEPLGPETTEALLALAPVDLPDFSPALSLDPRAFADAVEDALIADKVATTAGDQARFERMMEQLDRYVEDQALVLRREEALLDERAAKASRRREAAVGATARTAGEHELAAIEAERARVGKRLVKLEERADPDYQEWRERLLARRYRKPDVEQVLAIDFVVGGIG